MNIDKTTTGAGLVLVACAACCAPLIAPPVIAAIAAGGVGFALIGQLGLALVVVAAGGLYFLSRRKAAPNATFHSLMAQGECGCGPACASAVEKDALSIACTLGASDFKERVAGIRALARRSLRNADRTPLSLELTYGPEALDEVTDLMRKEQTCCAFLTFDLETSPSEVVLTITAPQAAAEAADLFVRPLCPRTRCIQP
ncbi:MULTISPECIES: hypothetical protein [Mesorhizobium]|uniref:hypothetical protein n=1 Tax=Mesorhizobium TaxID=68287 RepID=UPI0010A957AB|nr:MULTISPECIES: hypothetical protein [Mesorhizobium]